MNKRWKEIWNNTRKYKVFFGLLTVLLLAGTIEMTSAAQTEKRAANIKSKGNFDFENGTVFFASSDLVYLADEIDVLEDTYKTETVKALNGISTYFNLDGSITHNPEESTLASAGAPSLPYNAITAGILSSQSIPSQTYKGTLPGSKTETTGNISGAAGANLSLGAAAWVDGHLIVGTGEDNSAYYKNGYDAGNKKGYEDGYDAGNKKGYKDGYDAGYEKGHEDGYKEGNKKGYETGKKEGHDEGYDEGYDKGVKDGASQMTIKTGSYTWTFGGNKWVTDGSYLDIWGPDSSLSYNTGKSNLIACTISETKNLYFFSYGGTNENHFAPGQLTTSIDSSGKIYVNVPSGMRITNYYDTGDNDYKTTTITVTYYYY